MEKFTKLEIIQRYWQINRRVGHTYIALDGLLAFERKAIYVTTDRGVVEKLRERNDKIICFKPEAINLRMLAGFNCPLIVDHYAMQLLIEWHTKQVIERFKESVKERLTETDIFKQEYEARFDFHDHYCRTCSDGTKPGPGCINCRQTGYDQSPCINCPKLNNKE